jgi:methyl-accepting chemotaxis protein
MEQLEEMQKQLQVLAEAVRELAKEVQSNRKFIETQAELSRKTVEALKNINDAVYQTRE